MNVKVYSTPTCGYCHQAKKYLSSRGVEYTEYDVSCDQRAAQEMIDLTGQGGVPVIVIDGQTIIGFDRFKIDVLLSKGGAGNRPKLGLKVTDANKQAQKSDAVFVSGAFVVSVSPASLGEKAGLMQGDIITEANLKTINNSTDLEKALANLTTGTHLNIGYLRGQELLKAKIAV